MKTTVREISKDESQKWGNIARIRAIDPDFNAVIEALEKEANEKIEVKKVEVEGLMRDVNREYKKEVSKIESQYMKEKQEIDEKHRNKVREQYEVWIQKKHGNSIYKKLKEQRYFISLRQYLISKWLEEKGVDWDPFEEEKSDEKLREDYNIEAEVVLDDAIKPLRERLYRILDILLGKVISLQEGILKVRNILSINKEIQLTRAVKDFFDLLLFESEETTSEEIVDEEILSDYDIIGNIRCGRTNRVDERVIDQVKTGMRSLLQIPGTQLTGDIIEERLGILFGTKKEEAIRVYSNISFCITQTEGFLTEREKVVYFSLVKRILDDAESAIRQLDDEMKKLLKNEESKQIDNVGNKIEIEYARIKAEKLLNNKIHGERKWFFFSPWIFLFRREFSTSINIGSENVNKNLMILLRKSNETMMIF